MKKSLIFILSAFWFISCAQEQTKKATDIVESDGVKTTLHNKNVGKIRFSSNSYGQKVISHNDFISHYEISDHSNLNLIAYMDNSLTNYLHQLDTSLTAEALVKKGNYQFSFYLDDHLIYKENLHWRANTPTQKDKETILYRPLLSSESIDSWGRFLWRRFYFFNGGADVLETGSHRLKIEMRPYINNDELIVGDIIAMGKIDIKLHEPEVQEEQKAIQIIKPKSDWDLSGDSYGKEKIRALNERIAQNRFKDITSIVVIKNGELLIEEYFNGADRNTLHNTRSVGKSFASTVLGIAMEEGHIKSTQQKLSEFYDLSKFDNYSVKKDKVTLENLLTMSSGFSGSDNDSDSPGYEENMYPTKDWVKFALSLPMDKAKRNGKQWDYFTAGVVVLGDILDKSVPDGLEGYSKEKLFNPLGITNYEWQYTPQNVPNTAGGIQLRALDFAKYGQLYKNKGRWNGQQILPESWVKKSFTNYFETMPDQTPYGYLFWNVTYNVGEKTYEAFQCSGNGGNKIMVFNDLSLVIVITATAYGQPYGHSQVNRIMEHYILPAILQ